MDFERNCNLENLRKKIKLETDQSSNIDLKLTNLIQDGLLDMDFGNQTLQNWHNLVIETLRKNVTVMAHCALQPGHTSIELDRQFGCRCCSPAPSALPPAKIRQN